MNNSKKQKQIEEFAKEMRNQYYREYRKKNKEKVKEINRRYWLKRAAEEMKEG